MKYEKPIIEIMRFEIKDIVRTSPNVGLGGPDNDTDWT